MMRLGGMTSIVVALGLLWVAEFPAVPQAPQTSERWMREHGISGTIPSLRAALLSQDPEVRSSVASTLALDHDVESIPDLRRALEKERVDWVRINIAGDLLKLNDWQGLEPLRNMCTDRDNKPVSRLLAANRLLAEGDLTCLTAVVEIMEAKPDPPSRELSLQFLRRLTSFPATLHTRVRDILTAELKDETPINRQYASEALPLVGDRTSLSELEHAVSIEHDQRTRAHLEDNLRRLRTALR